jgi:FeS assembly protein IscX
MQPPGWKITRRTWKAHRFRPDMSDQASLGTLPDDTDFDPLTWEDSYAIALTLRREHPQVDLEQVSLGMIYRWTLALPEFTDDPQLANEEILSSIYQEWFEEVISL